ncbi:2-dehydro-3,6-dideoxy-6-sulfogluconate aldolase [Pandoraea fibrosis]|uniref:2-dehydro-3,6-dideoxy-6-sulfogluconate aldolase n=2 Tax=Pandoraea fibrosis TaxID=1891094 RepID=A0A5E4TM47_9BURK|nr:2-dehydro-3,6-dideoxy-6-sulfogluconate aldolase [Pandoraea fibrosis]
MKSIGEAILTSIKKKHNGLSLSGDTMESSDLIARLHAGQPVFALGLRSARSPDVIRWARAAGYDTVWIDMEHSPMPVDLVSQLCLCAADLGLMPWVRVPERDYGMINRVLDGGALGIVAARVESAGQATDIVTAARFAPLGQRSQLATLPFVGYEKLPAAEMNRRVNAATYVKLLIESRAGVEAASAIAAVPGVDIVALGCNDLSADLGHTGNPTHPDVLAACRHVIAAVRRQGKVAIVGGMPEGEALTALRADGAAPFIFSGIDTDLFLDALRRRVSSDRGALTPQ